MYVSLSENCDCEGKEHYCHLAWKDADLADNGELAVYEFKKTVKKSTKTIIE